MSLVLATEHFIDADTPCLNTFEVHIVAARRINISVFKVEISAGLAVSIVK
ncbi:hypothetical protein [Maricurvus nonylphenolicus]|uniref:hypothetical protein n=1 Tax=Maricurvus nonylphenolicus TaxID=1008307 RepID=UPI0036F26B22